MAAEAFCLLGGFRDRAFTLQEAAELFDVPTNDVDKALVPLLDANLIDCTGPGRFEMHELIHLYARGQYVRRFSSVEDAVRGERSLVNGFLAPSRAFRTTASTP